MHRWPGIFYVLSFGHSCDAMATECSWSTRAKGASSAAGTALWSESLAPHTVKNVDTSEIHVIRVELKSG